MFELLKFANLAYDKRMNYLRLVQHKELETKDGHYAYSVCVNVLVSDYSSEENEDLYLHIPYFAQKVISSQS